MHRVPHVPQISVSLAPETIVPELYSPFSTTPVDDDDCVRAVHLSPPPSSSSPRFMRQPSPLGPHSAFAGQGLERERFEALLLASRERNAAVGAKKGNDLRKEIALKAHSRKQVERRALFLSKVLAPPSPTATFLPKTPPDSPAIFNYTLPSPGLVSPLALFESLNENPAYGVLFNREPWVEQVDFRLPVAKKVEPHTVPKPTTPARPAKPIPSLDQISARLSSKGHVRTPSAEAAERKLRLPAFLAHSREPSLEAAERKLRLPAFLAHPREPSLGPTLAVGRLKLPVRSSKLDVGTADNLPLMPPRSPCYPLSPKLQVTTLVVPRSSCLSPTALSESNLLALNSRERRAKDMLSTLKKRTENGLLQDTDSLDRKWKRRSAPAELSPRARTGFEHPVLAMPGGF